MYVVTTFCKQVLCGLYVKIQAVLQRMPKEAAYRTHTQQIVQQRLQIVQAVSCVSVWSLCFYWSRDPERH